ncbi:MAG: urea carboxylase-associated family protein [Candidatus Rokubacteria bacterium]|nr:urea carboxylase-associated family protein [Candidatus Rokubacteria bacterium]
MATGVTGKDPAPGRIIRVIEIPARHGAALEVARGQILRVIDVEGQQVGDLVCFNRDDLGERYSPQNTVLFNRTIYPKVGAALVSDRGRPMMRLIADTVGVHDLICGSCSDEYYKNRLGHHGPHRSCRGNLAEAMAPWGVPLREIPFSFNVFMRWPVEPDGSVVPMTAPSGPGDYVDLQAEMDLVVAMSACPSDITPTNAHNPTPMRFVLSESGQKGRR